MPKVTITHNQGETPVIPGNAQRTILLLQNNTTKNVFYRLYGGVSLSDESKAGLLIAAAPEAGKPGGSMTITGKLAQRPLYAIHSGTGGDVVKIDVESDV